MRSWFQSTGFSTLDSDGIKNVFIQPISNVNSIRLETRNSQQSTLKDLSASKRIVLDTLTCESRFCNASCRLLDKTYSPHYLDKLL